MEKWFTSKEYSGKGQLRLYRKTNDDPSDTYYDKEVLILGDKVEWIVEVPPQTKVEFTAFRLLKQHEVVKYKLLGFI